MGSSRVVGFTRVRAGAFGSSGIVGFTWVRAWCRLVHPGSLVLSGSRWGSFGSSGVAGFTRARNGVVGLIGDRWVHFSSHWGS